MFFIQKISSFLGPFLLNLRSTVRVLAHEVWYRENVVKFKVKWLRKLRCLYPPFCQPVFGAFGNRSSDLIAYSRSGVRPYRIFIIGANGQVVTKWHNCWKKHGFSKDVGDVSVTYEILSSYVNDLFPPVQQSPFTQCICIWNFLVVKILVKTQLVKIKAIREHLVVLFSCIVK